MDSIPKTTAKPSRSRKIWCPGPERWISLGAYVRGAKLAKANPGTEFKQGITCWWPCTGEEIMRQFMHGVHDRINQGISYMRRGSLESRKAVPNDRTPNQTRPGQVRAVTHGQQHPRLH